MISFGDDMEKVIVATDGCLDTEFAKTAHGLIRGSDRFEVLGIVDSKFYGEDAGDILDGQKRDIPDRDPDAITALQAKL